MLVILSMLQKDTEFSISDNITVDLEKKVTNLFLSVILGVVDFF